MITKNDLNIVDTYVEGADETVWAHVEYDGRRYILTSTNVDDETLARVNEKDPMVGLFLELNLIPRKDNGVFRGDENWNIMGECDDNCEAGVCSKRLASDRPESPTIEHALDMLIRFLNN